MTIHTPQNPDLLKRLLVNEKVYGKKQIEEAVSIPIEIEEKIKELLTPYVGTYSDGQVKAQIIVVDLRFFEPIGYYPIPRECILETKEDFERIDDVAEMNLVESSNKIRQIGNKRRYRLNKSKETLIVENDIISNSEFEELLK